jgi:mannose-6-phosphate isomerase-like protein (cupin superfamily)
MLGAGQWRRSFMDASFQEFGQLLGQRSRQATPYLEFLRVASMSAGLYVLPAGAVDRQSPHQQDELYYVVRGRARMRAGEQDRSIGPGALIFVAAHAPHRFYDIEQDLELLVFFAPPESG